MRSAPRKPGHSGFASASPVMAAFSPLVLVVSAGDSELRAASNVASADVVQRHCVSIT